jgi:hypothetical protein
LTIKGNVKAAPANPLTEYPVAVGNLLLKSDVLHLGNIRNTETRTSLIEIFNNGTTPITPVFEPKSSFIILKSDPAIIAPNSKGMINIAVTGKAAKSYGTTETKFNVGYAGNPINKTITINTTVVDDLRNITPEQKENAPVMKVAPSTVEFGSVAAKGFNKTQHLKITNEGKSGLVIHSIKASSGLFTVSKGKKEIKPGETADFHVVLAGRVTGGVNNNIEIITNDPTRSVYRVLVTATN